MIGLTVAFYTCCRASRVQKARTGGQLLVFSPTFRNPAPLPADEEAELVQDCATKTENADAVKGDAVELNESHEDSTTTPFNMEVEVPVHESEKSQLSLSTRTVAVDKNAEEIKNELKCLRETLNQFVASKNSDAEVRQQQSSLELHMIRTENVLVENSKLQLKIEELEESMKENVAKAAGEKWTLNEELIQLQNKLTCVSHDAQSYLKALEEVKREFVIHSQGNSTEKEALLLQIHSLQAELEETRFRLAERESLLGALEKEHFAERKQLTDEHEDKLRNTRADFEAKILELSNSNNALKQIIVEYEAKIFSLEKSLLPESEAQLAQALSKLKRFEEDEVELRDRLSGYHQRIHEMTKDLKEAREEQEEERRNFQQLNQESSKAYDQIQRTIDEKDKVIQCLTCDIEQTSQALISATKKVQELSCELEKVQATMDTRTHDLTEMFKEVKSQLDASTKEKQQLERKLGETLEGIKENAAFINQEVMARNNETSAANKVLTGRIEHLLQELQRSKKECDDTKTRLATFDQREVELFNKLQESDRVRRGLHNRVMQLSGNIRVYVRVRPTIPGERHEGSEVTQGHKKRKHVEMETSSPFSYPGLGGNEATKSTLGADDPTKNLLEVQEPWTDRGGLSERRKKWTFGFDSIFTPHHGQNDIWEATEPLVQSAIDGYNVTVFAYGQTGSGKTYTMLGEPGEEGIVSRSIRMLFTAKESIAELTRGKSKVEISVELLEIYNEKVRDLLVSGKSDQNLKVKANEAVGSTVLPVDSENDVVEILHTAQSRRCVKATKSNAVSSRSHMLFTLHFKVSSKDGKTRVGKLNVCDLAGSERLGKSNANETVGVSHRNCNMPLVL